MLNTIKIKFEDKDLARAFIATGDATLVNNVNWI